VNTLALANKLAKHFPSYIDELITYIKTSVTEEIFQQKKRSIFGLFSGQSASGVLRESTPKDVVTATLGKLFHLHEKWQAINQEKPQGRYSSAKDHSSCLSFN